MGRESLKIGLPVDAPLWARRLLVNLNRSLQDIEEGLARREGLDDLESTFASSPSLQGNRVRNVGRPIQSSDAVRLIDLRELQDAVTLLQEQLTTTTTTNGNGGDGGGAGGSGTAAMVFNVDLLGAKDGTNVTYGCPYDIEIDAFGNPMAHLIWRRAYQMYSTTAPPNPGRWHLDTGGGGQAIVLGEPPLAGDYLAFAFMVRAG